jgi:murein L,D-transpeptidase YcbB/YkuD
MRAAIRFSSATGLTRALAFVFIASSFICMAPAAALADSAAEIRDILAAAHAPDIDFGKLNVGALRDFYARRADTPVWSGNARADADARTLLAALAHADQDGLEPLDYHVGAALVRTEPATPVEIAERDILLSDGALRYARELRVGRADLRALDLDVDLPVQPFDATGLLDAALKSGGLATFLAGLAPTQPEYAALKTALARYRQIDASGGWQPLPATLSVDVDETSGSGEALRDRLVAEGIPIDRPDSDDGLVEAVKRFQSRNGLDPDGRIGQRTLETLNFPASLRVQEIEANMERWRWLPRIFEPVRIVINVPAEQLDVIDNGRSVLSSRVVVGRKQAPTPILRAVATSVTVNPPWNVPSTIAQREILARLRANPHYLESENMVLVDGPRGNPYGLGIDWGAMSDFPYRVRQLPGPKNALGQLKLELPNRFDVYLHDTPAKAAFDLNERNLSHGCVRVQQIMPLASYALSSDAGAMVARLKDAIASGTTQHIAMARPLPVYVLYWTAFADSDGTFEFRRDIYGRDQRLIAARGGPGTGQNYTLNAVGCTKT